MKDEVFLMKKRSVFKLLLPLFLIASLILLCSCSGKSSSAGDNYAEKLETENTVTDTVIGTDAEFSDVQTNAKIIRNVTLNGETKDFGNAVETIKAQLSQSGGYVEKSEISGGESLANGRKTERYAVFTLRIPADKLDSFLEKAGSLLNITSSTETTTDVTLEYYDIEARLETLRSKKLALEEMLAKAQTLDEIIFIQDELYAVISDIESYQSRLNVLESKVSYSTVTLTVNEVNEYTEVIDEEPTFGERISEAFSESFAGMGEFLQDFAVFLVAALPIVLFLGLIAAVVLTIIWLCKRGKKKKINKP